MHPVLFTIPIINWPVHIYGIMVVSGFLLAIFVAYRQAAQHGTMEDDVLDFGFWALLGGIFGARLIFILVEWQDFFVHRPFIEFGNTGIKIPHVLALWRGGIVYWGSF